MAGAIAYISRDTDGQLWDICKGECARQAGIREASGAEQRVQGDLELGGVDRPQEL